MEAPAPDPRFSVPLGVKGSRFQPANTAELDEAIRTAPDLSVVFIETPANPTIVMTDLRRATEAAGRRSERPLVMVDNTFLGPAFQHPLPLGADMVIIPPRNTSRASAT